MVLPWNLELDTSRILLHRITFSLHIRADRQHFYVKRQIPLIYDIRVQQVERKSYSGHQFPVDKISHGDCLYRGFMD